MNSLKLNKMTGKGKKSGGSREGAGRKMIYAEKTITIAFRCPESRREQMKEIIKLTLTQWLANPLKIKNK